MIHRAGWSRSRRERRELSAARCFHVFQKFHGFQPDLNIRSERVRMAGNSRGLNRMSIEVWAVNYKENGELHVKVFDNERQARSFVNHPPHGIKIVGKPWDVCG